MVAIEAERRALRVRECARRVWWPPRDGSRKLVREEATCFAREACHLCSLMSAGATGAPVPSGESRKKRSASTRETETRAMGDPID